MSDIPVGPTARPGLASAHREHTGGEGTAAGIAATGERAVPYHCPFCAEDDLRPHGDTHGAWHCRACLRVFGVRFLGIEAPQPPTRAATPPPARTTGGSP